MSPQRSPYFCNGGTVQGLRLFSTSSATACRPQSNTVTRRITCRLDYLDGVRLKVTKVDKMTNIFHGPFLASSVSGLRETLLSETTSHEAVITYIVDRSHEILADSRSRYLACSLLNIALRAIVRDSIWAGGFRNVLCFNVSQGHHGVSPKVRGKTIVSLELKLIAMHGSTDSMDQSPNLWIHSRWYVDCEVCSLCGRLAVGH